MGRAVHVAALTRSLRARWPDRVGPARRRRYESRHRAHAADRGNTALARLAERQLLPLLRAQPELAVQAPSERLARELPARAGDPAGLLKRGWRLINSGQISDGIRLLTSAVAAARRLTDPAGLECALRVLGKAQVQAANGVAAAEAFGGVFGGVFGGRSRLWNDHGARVRPPADEVALRLTDLSFALWRRCSGESLKIRHQAIVQLRRLVATNPRLRPTLARVLLQQAEQFRESDRYRDSLEALNDTEAAVPPPGRLRACRGGRDTAQDGAAAARTPTAGFNAPSAQSARPGRARRGRAGCAEIRPRDRRLVSNRGEGAPRAFHSAQHRCNSAGRQSALRVADGGLQGVRAGQEVRQAPVVRQVRRAGPASRDHASHREATSPSHAARPGLCGVHIG